jgi:hypothetical protein
MGATTLFAVGDVLKIPMDAICIQTRQVTDHPEIPARILPDPSPREALFAKRLFAGRLQISQNGKENMLP